MKPVGCALRLVAEKRMKNHKCASMYDRWKSWRIRTNGSIYTNLQMALFSKWLAWKGVFGAGSLDWSSSQIIKRFSKSPVSKISAVIANVRQEGFDKKRPSKVTNTP